MIHDSLQNVLQSKKSNFTIIIDSSKSISAENFKKTKLILHSLITNITFNSKIQIINFSSYSEVVTEFTEDKNVLLFNAKELKHHGGGTNLNNALELSLTRINTIQKEYRNIVVVVTDGMPTDNPDKTILTMISKGIKFFTIGVGNKVTQDKLDCLFIGQTNILFKHHDDFILCLEKFSPNILKLPITHKIFPTNYEVQRSSRDFKISFFISSIEQNRVFDAYSIEISLCENDYYYGFKTVVPDKVGFKLYECKMELRVKSNCTTTDIPRNINFLIKIDGKEYNGSFSLDLAWFAEDLSTPYNINIFSDGFMGHGKSSIHNLLFNLFSSNQNTINQIKASKSENHVTKGLEFHSIKDMLDKKSFDNSYLPIYEKIISKVNITLVDKLGISKKIYIDGKGNETVEFTNNIDYLLAKEGRYKHDENSVKEGNKSIYDECHSLIFVISLASLGDKNIMNHVKSKIFESIDKAGITPILVVTFCDNYNDVKMLEDQKKQVYDLKIEKENIFFITPYIEGLYKRDPSKDLLGWKLLNRAVEISRQNVLKKLRYLSSEEKQRLLVKNYEKLNISHTDEVPKVIEDKPFIVGDETNQKTTTKEAQEKDSKPCSPQFTPALNNYPDFAAQSIEKSNTIMLTIHYNSKIAKFKESSKISVKEFTKKVSKKFSITEDITLQDSDECDISDDLVLGDAVEDKSELYVIITDDSSSNINNSSNI